MSVLNGKIKALEEMLMELIVACPEAKDKLSLLTQYSGVGNVSAVQLLVNLPELGSLKGKNISSLAGVAPFARDSGKIKGKRYVSGGRPVVKKALFLIALSAIRFNEKISAYYTGLIARGKNKMVAITACMRKIILHLNAMLRDNKLAV